MSPLRAKSISSRKKVDPIGHAVFYPTGIPSSPLSRRSSPPGRYSISTVQSSGSPAPLTPPCPSTSRAPHTKAAPTFYLGGTSYPGTPGRSEACLIDAEGVSPMDLNKEPGRTEYPFPTASNSTTSPNPPYLNTQFVPASPHGLSVMIENWNLATPPNFPPPRHNSTFGGLVTSDSNHSISTVGTELRSPPDLPSSQGFHSRILPISDSPTDSLRQNIPIPKLPRRSSDNPVPRSPFLPSSSLPSRPSLIIGQGSPERIANSPGNRSPAPIPFRQPSWSNIRRDSVPALALNVQHAPQQAGYFFPPHGLISPPQIQPLTTNVPLGHVNLDLDTSGPRMASPLSYDLFTPGYNMGGAPIYPAPSPPNALELSLGHISPNTDRSSGTFGSFSQPSTLIPQHPATQTAQSNYSQNTHISSPSDPAKSTVAAKHLEDHILPTEFIHRYILADELGSGGFGFVCSANMTGNDNEFGREVAVKFIFKERLENTKDALVEGEPMESWVLRGCDHPNIIAWVDLFEDDKFFILVQELHGDPWSEDHTLHSSHPEPHTDPGRRMSLLQTPAHRSPSPLISPNSPLASPYDLHMSSSDGSISRPRMGRRASHDLFEAVESMRFTEEESKWIFKQIVSGVSYLHKKGIYHRDLKDENIVIDRYLNVKIIDFGSAVVEDHLQAPNLYGSFRGTYSYASPEVLQGSWYHASPCDIWSIGIILAILLTGEQPFPDRQHSLTGRFKLKRPTSEGARDLMEKVFRPDPTRRWGIEKVEKHRWLRNVKRPRNLPMPPSPEVGMGLGMGMMDDGRSGFKTLWSGIQVSGSGSMGPPPVPVSQPSTGTLADYKFGSQQSVPTPMEMVEDYQPQQQQQQPPQQQGRSLLGRLKKRISA